MKSTKVQNPRRIHCMHRVESVLYANTRARKLATPRCTAWWSVVSYPDPALIEGKGLVTIERFLGFAESSLLRACAKDSVLIVKYGEFAESVTNDCITSCDISRK